MKRMRSLIAAAMLSMAGTAGCEIRLWQEPPPPPPSWSDPQTAFQGLDVLFGNIRDLINHAQD